MEIDEMERVKVGSQMQLSMSTYMPIYFFHRAAVVFFSMMKIFWKKMGMAKMYEKTCTKQHEFSQQKFVSWGEV